MSLYPYSPTVDEFFAKHVTKQYIAKACPTGESPLQCIEGNTFAAPYHSRTHKRQSQLRLRQLPTAVKLHNMYETRKHALLACHGRSHEEQRVLSNPMLAAAMTLAQAESQRACSRYIESSSIAEHAMVRAVQNRYSKAVNASGVFSTACTDAQARYEAYLAQTRGKAVEFRAKQYSPAMKAGARFAARRRAIARQHVCSYEDGLYSKFPKVASAMRPAFGYYSKFVNPQFCVSSSRTVQTVPWSVTNHGALDNDFGGVVFCLVVPFVTSPSDRKIPNTPYVPMDVGRMVALTRIALMTAGKVAIAP